MTLEANAGPAYPAGLDRPVGVGLEERKTRALIARLVEWWSSTPTVEKTWLAIGFVAQLMFAMRFVVQWVASEREKRSIVPEQFWYFSVAGGMLLLAYACYRFDPVFILGQGLGLLIYVRNIYFIRMHKP